MAKANNRVNPARLRARRTRGSTGVCVVGIMSSAPPAGVTLRCGSEGLYQGGGWGYPRCVMAAPPEASQTPRPRSRRRMLGEMLVERGVITPEQAEEVLERQKREKGSRLGRILVDLGMATEVQIADVIADQLHIPAADLAAAEPTEAALALMARE